MNLRQIPYTQQTPVPVIYKGYPLGDGFKADFIVHSSLVLELKANDSIAKVHVAQLINYLKLLKIKTGYILNLNTAQLKSGIKRISI